MDNSELKCIFVELVGKYVSISTYNRLAVDSWIGPLQRRDIPYPFFGDEE